MTKLQNLDSWIVQPAVYPFIYIYSAYQIKLPGMGNLLKYLLKAMFTMYEYRSNNRIRVEIS